MFVVNMLRALRRLPCLALILAFQMSGGALAQNSGTVSVGGQLKRTSGIFVDAVAGDVACYLTLKDDKGVEFHEMTGFEICEKSSTLKGKRVALTYGFALVLADECGGNPDCKKTRRAVVVNTATVIDTSARKK